MAHSYWLKQTKPLFSELEWNKPERRDRAGRLLIMAGNVHNLSAAGKSFELARKTGIGSIKVALPDKTKRLVGPTLSEALYLPSTASGEFSSDASGELLNYAQWSDTVLLPGNLGRNSQTSILLEELLRSLKGQIVLACDAIEAASNNIKLLLDRSETTLILSFAQLQKLGSGYGTGQLLTYGMDLIRLIETLHGLTLECKAGIITLHQNQFIVTYGGSVSTTKIRGDNPKTWRVAAATYAACFQTWNPTKPFESLTHTASLL